MNDASDSFSESDASPEFADFVISLCFRSDELSAKELASILQLQPTTARPKGIPWQDGGGDAQHHVYFQHAERSERPVFAFEQFEHQLCTLLRPFAERLDALALVRSRCERIVLACSLRTSRGILMAPFSPDTLRLLAAVGIELHFNASTRASKNRNQLSA